MDGLSYHSNYTSGLRVLDTANVAVGSLTEIAFFDTFPSHSDPTFDGTWSNYPFFSSGTIAVSGIDEGLFLLRLSDDVNDGPRDRKGPPPHVSPGPPANGGPPDGACPPRDSGQPTADR